MRPTPVLREIVMAYEKRSGFAGLGEFFEQKGIITMIEEENSCLLNVK